MSVSMTTTVNTGFGSKVVSPATGTRTLASYTKTSVVLGPHHPTSGCAVDSAASDPD
jgi:gamma-glutamyltranspeptidase